MISEYYGLCVNTSVSMVYARQRNLTRVKTALIFASSLVERLTIWNCVLFLFGGYATCLVLHQRTMLTMTVTSSLFHSELFHHARARVVCAHVWALCLCDAPLRPWKPTTKKRRLLTWNTLGRLALKGHALSALKGQKWWLLRTLPPRAVRLEETSICLTLADALRLRMRVRHVGFAGNPLLSEVAPYDQGKKRATSDKS